MNNLGQRIANIRKKLGMNQDDFGATLQVKGKGTVSGWERNERTPDLAVLSRIADLGKVSLDWLITGVESTFSPPITPIDELKGDENIISEVWYVPVVTKVTAGDRNVILEESNVEYMFPVRNKPTSTSLMLEVQGDSMMREKGKSINPGDLVMIDIKEMTAYDGDLVVIATVDGRQLIKQYVDLDEEKIELRSFNTDYPPIYVKKADIVSFFRVLQVHPRVWRP